MADIGGEENASDVGGMCDKLAYGQDGCSVATLDHSPDIDITLSLLLESIPRVSALKR